MTFRITPHFNEHGRAADEVEWQRLLRRIELLGYQRLVVRSDASLSELLTQVDDGSVLMSTPEGVNRDDLKKAGGEMKHHQP